MRVVWRANWRQRIRSIGKLKVETFSTPLMKDSTSSAVRSLVRGGDSLGSRCPGKFVIQLVDPTQLIDGH